MTVRWPVSRLLFAALTFAACREKGEVSTNPVASDGEAVQIISSCPARQPAPPGGVRLRHNITYSTVGGAPLALDLAIPQGDGPHPVAILLHGGSWVAGDRRDTHHEMVSFARHGWAAAAVSYRLTREGHNTFPAAAQDVRCAARWLRQNAGEHLIDADRMVAVGYSAGAHLASLLGTAADARELDGPCPATADASVQGVISYAGPQALRVQGPYTDEQARIVTHFLGAFPGDDPARAALASPLAHASHGDPPFLLVHGSDDPLVPIGQSRRMVEALRQVGGAATLVEVDGIGHGFVGLASSTMPRVRCTTLAFLELLQR